MHKMTSYPLGNADCSLVNLANGKRLLFDYANLRDEKDDKDLRADLVAELMLDFEEKKDKIFDVVALTHADDDHIHGATDFFYLDHAEKYQDNNRVKIKELWVPAAFVTEAGLTGEASILRAEARHRLKKGYGIRVFARPDSLKGWLEENGLSVDARKNLIVDAGQIVPGFSVEEDELEIFAHSPFAIRGEVKFEDRNTNSLVVQLTFVVKKQDTRAIMGSDVEYAEWSKIVGITRKHKNEARLCWDIFKISHHCSYDALAEEKGKDKTEPIGEVAWLFEQGRKKAILVSTSKPIPTNDDDEQPPHRQAANYYNEVASNLDGTFKVTMEHLKQSNPEPLVILIGEDGAKVEKKLASVAAVLGGQSSPRAGAVYDKRLH
ncbi:hypothetical protein MUP01_10205 [Candidatus Bathyarchaeota archaeon]|nr:hypothetical protein [Candidatus Bathyarchaeota archaeon]